MAPSNSDKTIGDRLKAWWYGYELEPVRPSAAAVAAAEAEEKEPEPAEMPAPGPQRGWSEERIHAIQMVLGPGCHSPDVAARTAELIAPAGLTSAMTVLELGAGLGLGARTIARQTGAWVDAIESNPKLMEAARALGTDIEEDRKVTLSSSALDEPEIMRHRRDLILFRDGLHRYSDPKKVLEQLRALLKPTGKLFLTDFVLPENGSRKDLKEWIDQHEEPVNLWKPTELRQALTVLGLEVHLARNESAAYASQTLHAIQGFAQRLEDEPVPHAWREWVMVEIEYWARIVTLLERGKLQHIRITASVHK